MHNGGRVLLVVLNLYVQIKIHMATFNTNHSVTDSMQTITAASVQKLSDSVVKCQLSLPLSQRVRRNDQVID